MRSVEKSAPFAAKRCRLARPGNLAASARFGVFKAPLHSGTTDGAPVSYHPDDYAGQKLAINHIENGIAIRAADGHALNSEPAQGSVRPVARVAPDWKILGRLHDRVEERHRSRGYHGRR